MPFSSTGREPLVVWYGDRRREGEADPYSSRLCLVWTFFWSIQIRSIHAVEARSRQRTGKAKDSTAWMSSPVTFHHSGRLADTRGCEHKVMMLAGVSDR